MNENDNRNGPDAHEQVFVAGGGFARREADLRTRRTQRRRGPFRHRGRAARWPRSGALAVGCCESRSRTACRSWFGGVEPLFNKEGLAAARCGAEVKRIRDYPNDMPMRVRFRKKNASSARLGDAILKRLALDSVMRARASKRNIELLLVEDNPGDVLFTEEALQETSIPVRLSVVADGEAALLFLRRIGAFASAPRPDLILLDLNLPKISGIEVLAEVKRDPNLRRIPIVVFTTSNAEDDIKKTYDLHANGFITKPTGFVGYSAAMRALEGFWLGAAELPPR